MMWVLNDQRRNTNKESTNACTNDLPIFTQKAEDNLPSRSPDEALTGNSLINEIGQMYREKLKKTDDVINKWQLNDKVKCLRENAQNIILQSSCVNFSSSQEHSSNSRSNNNFVLENEAVLMAIELKGLRRTHRCYNVEKPERNHCYSVNDNNDDVVERYRYPNLKREYMLKEYDVGNQKLDNEIEKNNFETNFLSKAVSTAIEVKGLAYSKDS